MKHSWVTFSIPYLFIYLFIRRHARKKPTPSGAHSGFTGLAATVRNSLIRCCDRGGTEQSYSLGFSSSLSEEEEEEEEEDEEEEEEEEEEEDEFFLFLDFFDFFFFAGPSLATFSVATVSALIGSSSSCSASAGASSGAFGGVDLSAGALSCFTRASSCTSSRFLGTSSSGFGGSANKMNPIFFFFFFLQTVSRPKHSV